MRRHLLPVLALVALAATACGDSSVSTAEAPQGAPATAAESIPAPDEAADSTAVPAASDDSGAADAESGAAAENVAASTPIAEVQERPIAPDAPGITLLTPASGQGSRPLLAWEPVDGAIYYSVVVYDPGGGAYWGTFVEETETFVGGPVQLLEDKPGPRIVDGMSWSVVASDADLVPLAISGIRPIGP